MRTPRCLTPNGLPVYYLHLAAELFRQLSPDLDVIGSGWRFSGVAQSWMAPMALSIWWPACVGPRGMSW
jgi:hypothetical protein